MLALYLIIDTDYYWVNQDKSSITYSSTSSSRLFLFEIPSFWYTVSIYIITNLLSIYRCTVQSLCPSPSSASGSPGICCTLASKSSIRSLLPKYLLFLLHAQCLVPPASPNTALPYPEGHFQPSLSIQ